MRFYGSNSKKIRHSRQQHARVKVVAAEKVAAKEAAAERAKDIAFWRAVLEDPKGKGGGHKLTVEDQKYLIASNLGAFDSEVT